MTKALLKGRISLIIIMTIAFALVLTLSLAGEGKDGSSGGSPAFAAAADYTIDGSDCEVVGGINKFYNSEDGFKVKVLLSNSLYDTNLRIVYSAWALTYDGTDPESDGYDEDKITQNPFIKDNQDRDVNKIAVPEIYKGDQSLDGTGRGSRWFEITLYDNCALRFDMYYFPTAMDVMETESQGELIFYTDLVDSYFPTVVKENDGIFIDGGYRFTVTMRGNPINTLSRANSGLKSYEYCRFPNKDSNERIVIKSSEDDSSFTSSITNKSYKLSIDILLKDGGDYYLYVTDNVGNTTASYLASMEVTSDKTDRLRSIENFLSHEGTNYLEDDLEKLERLASNYAVAPATEEEASLNSLVAYQQELTAQIRNFETKVINPEYVSDGKIIIDGYNEGAVSIFKGQKATLQISVAAYTDISLVSGVVDKAALNNNPDKAYGLNISQIISRASTEKMEENLKGKVKITVPLSKKYVEAVALCYDSDTQTYVELKYDRLVNSLILYVDTVPSVVYIVVSDGKEGIANDGGLKWLYSLFALIPIGVGLFFFIKKGKKNPRGWKKVTGGQRQDSRTESKEPAPKEAKENDDLTE